MIKRATRTTRGHAALLATALALPLGCAHETTPPPEPMRAEYRIGREDVITVEVWKDPALSAKVPVRPDGNISLPMIGDVHAEGHTADELKRDIATRLAPFVEQPVVGVMVTEVNAARFFVLGEVAHPGAFPVRGEVSVIQALALAGGPTEFANQRAVIVIRPQAGHGQKARYKVDCREVLAGNAPAIALQPGDTVFVP